MVHNMVAESLNQVAKALLQRQSILILTHKNPDGDTLGSGFALYYALKQFGKNAAVICSDQFPEKYAYMLKGYTEEEFEPDLVVAVDIADPQLLGGKLSCYADSVDICIDHHISNQHYAALSYVDGGAAATCEIMASLLEEMGADIDRTIANCLYTGLATDTGCFKFSNTTAGTHRAAADLIEIGCDYEVINREMFDTKSRGRIMVEREVLDQIGFYFRNQVAVIVISQELVHATGIEPTEIDGITGLPRQIEGVEVGITLREKESGGYKVSVRTCRFVDASEVCQKLGGGGHQRAAGCVVDAPLEEAKQTLIDVLEPYFLK